jgi:hypothetical protein
VLIGNLTALVSSGIIALGGTFKWPTTVGDGEGEFCWAKLNEIPVVDDVSLAQQTLLVQLRQLHNLAARMR